MLLIFKWLGNKIISYKYDKHTILRGHEHAVRGVFVDAVGAGANHLRRHAVQSERQSETGAGLPTDLFNIIIK